MTNQLQQMRDASEAARQREESELAREQQAEDDMPEYSPSAKRPQEVVPHVGQPLDGSQYQEVVDEQLWAEKPPTQEEQRRRQTKFDASPTSLPSPAPSR